MTMSNLSHGGHIHGFRLFEVFFSRVISCSSHPLIKPHLRLGSWTSPLLPAWHGNWRRRRGRGPTGPQGPRASHHGSMPPVDSASSCQPLLRVTRAKGNHAWFPPRDHTLPMLPSPLAVGYRASPEVSLDGFPWCLILVIMCHPFPRNTQGWSFTRLSVAGLGRKKSSRVAPRLKGHGDSWRFFSVSSPWLRCCWFRSRDFSASFTESDSTDPEVRAKVPCRSCTRGSIRRSSGASETTCYESQTS